MNLHCVQDYAPVRANDGVTYPVTYEEGYTYEVSDDLANALLTKRDSSGRLCFEVA